MIRSIFATLAAATVVSVLGAQGCKQTGVGDPCIPEQEYDTTFNGFDPNEVNVESKSFQCQTRLCLVNHFRGRVTCPYGQDATGTGLPTTGGASGGALPTTDSNCPTDNPNCITRCVIPGGNPSNQADQVTGRLDSSGNPIDPKVAATVDPQCLDREAANSVYCSCRCANANGRTDDGANYCSCPDGFTCSQLVNPVGATDVGLTGAYCIKKDTEYQSFSACTLPCDPTLPTQNCAPPSIR
jgi:hypothetical protein